MRLPALAAFILSLCTLPALADCDAGGQKTVEGGRVCHAGMVSVCSAGAWLQTTLTCTAPAGAAAQLIATPPAPQTFLIHVLNARFLKSGAALDVTFTARRLCDGKLECTLAPANLLPNEPLHRLSGTFNVGYACRNGFETRNAEQAVFSAEGSRTLTCRE